MAHMYINLSNTLSFSLIISTHLSFDFFFSNDTQLCCMFEEKKHTVSVLYHCDIVLQ
jgi:hypothetical protein